MPRAGTAAPPGTGPAGRVACWHDNFLCCVGYGGDRGRSRRAPALESHQRAWAVTQAGPMRVFAEVAELLGDGYNTAANEGTFHNVRVQTGPDITECKPGQVVVDVKAACINYPDLLQTVVRTVLAALVRTEALR